MIVIEYKIKARQHQYQAIKEKNRGYRDHDKKIQITISR